jgi:hypothetical protein
MVQIKPGAKAWPRAGKDDDTKGLVMVRPGESLAERTYKIRVERIAFVRTIES